MTTINIDWLRNEISEAEKKVGFNSTSLTQRINESRLLTLKSVLDVCKEEEEKPILKGKELKKAIIDKAVELGFKQVSFASLKYDLPLGFGSRLNFDESDLELGIVNVNHGYCSIRNIESPEDLETLFNAICPEKFRLPFD